MMRVGAPATAAKHIRQLLCSKECGTVWAPHLRVGIEFRKCRPLAGNLMNFTRLHVLAGQRPALPLVSRAQRKTPLREQRGFWV